MRIKSYFAPSVQAAIALARREFGDGVTLVTSHVAALENRHLGEYEVVFAIEEGIEPEAESIAAVESQPEPAPAFTQMLQQAMAAPLPMHEDLSDKLERIHASLIGLGLESALVRAFMTMLKATLPAVPEAVEVEAMPAALEIDRADVTLPLDVTPDLTLSLPQEEAQGDEAQGADMPAAAIEELPEPVLAAVSLGMAEPPAAEAERKQAEPPLPSPLPLPLPSISPAPRPFLSLFEAPSVPPTRFSAAELAFMSSVSSAKEPGA